MTALGKTHAPRARVPAALYRTMRLDDERLSSNVEDLRGQGGSAGRSLGLGGVLVALVIGYFFGIDPATILGLLDAGQTATVPVQRPAALGPRSDDRDADFVKRVLATTEDTWGEIFAKSGHTYVPPTLVLFSGATPTACGTGRSATGPFYCPGDQRIYIDLDFYRLMRDRFHAGGDAAQAYVIAHEVGHHVQNLMGVTGRMQSQRAHVSAAQYNFLSVKLELQADCLAGVWARRTDQARHFLDPGEFEGALNAAAAIGDDTLQRQAQGYVVPDSFTHGTSQQRVRWLGRGFAGGDLHACETFRAQNL